MSKPKKATFKNWKDRIDEARDNVQNIAQEMRDALDEWEPKEGSDDEDKKSTVEGIADTLENVESDLDNAMRELAEVADIGE